MPRPVASATDPGIALRSGVIAVLAIALGFLPKMPPDSGIAPTTLIAIGIALQLAIASARYFAQRYEQRHDRQHLLVPRIMHIGTLVGDGLTVLLCAIGVFRAIAAQLQTY